MRAGKIDLSDAYVVDSNPQVLASHVGLCPNVFKIVPIA
jgi:hypothetical protein